VNAMQTTHEQELREAMPPNHKPKPSSDVSATAQVIAMSELDPVRASASSPAAPLIRADADRANPLRNVNVNLTVCVGSAVLTVGELLGAKVQQVLRLDREVEQPVDILLEGQVVARGTLLAVDEHFAVRITELPRSLDLPLGGPAKAS